MREPWRENANAADASRASGKDKREKITKSIKTKQHWYPLIKNLQQRYANKSELKNNILYRRIPLENLFSQAFLLLFRNKKKPGIEKWARFRVPFPYLQNRNA